MNRPLRIAIFDYQVVRTNPIGGCHRRLLSALADEHEFTVFAVEFDNPRPERIKWVRIPVPLRPLPLLFVAYHLIAPLLFLLHKVKSRKRFDLIQTVESKLSFGDVAYSHFCHSSYLNEHWSDTNSRGLRGLSRWLDHRLHALAENYIYRKLLKVIVPSNGLAMEMAQQFPVTADKLQVLPNAINVHSLRCPEDFDRTQHRMDLGVKETDVVFVFAALGHFERKGLPLLMEAISQLDSQQAKLLVVGGTSDLVSRYRIRAQALDVGDRVLFVGMRQDIRPYLWISDAFTLASTYETFSLVAFEAAAASLPLITPLLHGVEDIVRNGETGFVVKRTLQDYTQAMDAFLQLPPIERDKMGQQARLSASRYDESRFVDNWRKFYSEWRAETTTTGHSHQPIPAVRTA